MRSARADSGAVVDGYFEREGSGAKGYLGTPRHPGLPASWRDFAPPSIDESGDAATFSELYEGCATKCGRGRWGDIRFRADIPPEDLPAPDPSDVAKLATSPAVETDPQRASAAVATEHLRTSARRGFVNYTASDAWGRRPNQRYAISASQALYSRRDYIGDRFRRHAEHPVGPEDFRSSNTCYLSALSNAQVAAPVGEICRLDPNGHSLWPGEGWGKATLSYSGIPPGAIPVERTAFRV